MCAMSPSQSKQTLAEEVYSSLRARLLRAELEPGSKLKLGDLGTEYAVSLSVVREAVTRLAEQGLVRAIPQRGFVVTPLTVEDLQDLTRARVLIEVLALRESIAHGGLAWEARVLASHHTLQRTPMNTPDGHLSEAWTSAHRDFHHALVSGCQSPRVETIATGLRDCSELYQHWSRELAHDTDRDVAAEHKELAELAVAGDADRAATALKAHIERTTAALVRFANGRGTEPVGDSRVPA
jgi:DNA-binding GntR family transcriptional regulator